MAEPRPRPVVGSTTEREMSVLVCKRCGYVITDDCGCELVHDGGCDYDCTYDDTALDERPQGTVLKACYKRVDTFLGDEPYVADKEDE